MLEVYAAWIEGAKAEDIEAIKRAIEAALRAEHRYMEQQSEQRRIVELEVQQARYEASPGDARYRGKARHFDDLARPRTVVGAYSEAFR